MSSGTQVELDWAAIDAAQGGDGAAGAGGARGTGAGAPSEPSSYPSDEEILEMEPVGQASESVWQLGLDGTGILRAGGCARCPIFWSTTPSKPICCHRA